MIRFTRLMQLITIPGLGSLISPPVVAEDQSAVSKRLFVTVTGNDAQDRAMPLVLASQAMDQGAQVRVLLCGEGGLLAIESYQAAALAPRGLTPKDLLGRLIEHGATVEVCAIFLPNSDFKAEDLMEGIGTACPDDVATWMMEPDTRLFTM